MKKQYQLTLEEQKELIEITKNNKIILLGNGQATISGANNQNDGVKKSRAFWKRLAKQYGFKVKSVAPDNEQDDCFWATPTKDK